MTELLILRDPYYGRMCFKSVKTLGGSPFLAVKKASAFGLGPFSQLRMESSSGIILYIVTVQSVNTPTSCLKMGINIIDDCKLLQCV